MTKVVLLRHGESVWNSENRFTGWTDVDLSVQGIEEATVAGHLLKEQGYVFDRAFTSVLKRAIRTLWIVLDELDQMWLPIELSWRLNERHYGALQGLNKAETAKKYGDEQVHIWRRSYAIRPPALDKSDPRYPGHEQKYSRLAETEIPITESLKDTIDRFLPYWHEQIGPRVVKGERILISAHGNTLRALVKYLDQLSDDRIPLLEIPTGIPLVYELDQSLTPRARYYLGDSQKAQKAQKELVS